MRRRHPANDHQSHVEDAGTTKSTSGGGIEARLERLESLLTDVLAKIEMNTKRLNALQAQLDHVSAHRRSV